ncbi:MAG: glycosyltransferase family 2 protein [Candidatus Dadabacteria bacterium]|nr:MAG: glycosyltransferase family 2 protein [Candidatus Dadabacteria bacterium]
MTQEALRKNSKNDYSSSAESERLRADFKWTSEKLREVLKAHYSLLEENAKLKAQMPEFHRLQRYAPDRLSTPLKLLFKAAIVFLAEGPRGIWQSYKNRKKYRSVQQLPDFEPWPEIEVLTLSYNSERFIPGYFKAWSEVNYPPEKLRIHILDNNSADNSHKLLKEQKQHYSDLNISIYQSKKNLGFAGGNNYLLLKVLPQSTAKFVFLLNIDTEIDRDCLNRLVGVMQHDPNTGMAEARQTPREHPKSYDPETLETSWCSCGGVLIRRAALEATGFFDDRFFLYAEDVDLSWRMWLKGWKCKINPEATYRHITETLDSKKDLSTQLYYSVRNSFFMHFKYDSLLGILKHIRFVRAVIKAEQNPDRKKIIARAARDYLKFLPSLLVSHFTTLPFRARRQIKFSGFDYGERRQFRDTPDGRTFLDT